MPKISHTAVDPQGGRIIPTVEIEPGQEERQDGHRASLGSYEKNVETEAHLEDVFGNEEFAEVKYKVLKWW